MPDLKPIATIRLSQGKLKIKGEPNLDEPRVMGALRGFKRALIEVYSCADEATGYLNAVSVIREKARDIYLALTEGGRLDLVMAKAHGRVSIMVNCSKVRAELFGKLLKALSKISLGEAGALKLVVDVDMMKIPQLPEAELLSGLVAASRLAEFAEALKHGFRVVEILPEGKKVIIARSEWPPRLHIRGYSLDDVEPLLGLSYVAVEGDFDLALFAGLAGRYDRIAVSEGGGGKVRVVVGKGPKSEAFEVTRDSLEDLIVSLRA